MKRYSNISITLTFDKILTALKNIWDYWFIPTFLNLCYGRVYILLKTSYFSISSGKSFFYWMMTINSSLSRGENGIIC